MATMDIAIEIGTTFTSIYVSGEGVVLREPSVVAYYGDDKKLLAVGRDAWEKKGKTPDGTTVVCPVADGYVSDFDVTKDMSRSLSSAFYLRLTLSSPKSARFW